jgi:hypothetical protein
MIRLEFRLFLSDAEHIASRQKGKSRMGEWTDAEYSLLLWEQELLTAEQNSEDRRMALSMSNAVASDQSAITALRVSERTAESDRAMALSLGGEAILPAPMDHNERDMLIGKIAKDGVFDTVSEVMSSLMGGLDLASEDAGSERGEISTSSRSTPMFPQCVSYLERVAAPRTFTSPCGHIYCNPCTKQLFVNATKDEDLYPPRCCGNLIFLQASLFIC